MSERKYYFWLVGWSYKGFYPLFNAYVLCEVDESGFTIRDSKRPVQITWNQVSKIALYSKQNAPGASQNTVELFLTIDEKVRTIYLHAMNMMNSSSLHHVQENETLVNVMNVFRNHGSITVHPNPYYRAFERVGKPDYFLLQNWDPTVSPKEYRKHPAIKNAILRSQKRGILWAYWLTTAFVAIVSFLILIQAGQDELDAVAVLGSMWLFMTIFFSWIISSANRDLSK